MPPRDIELRQGPHRHLMMVMTLDPEIFPFGYAAEAPGDHPVDIRETAFGWEVRRFYVLYDGRPAAELVAVYGSRDEADAYRVRLAAHGI